MHFMMTVPLIAVFKRFANSSGVLVSYALLKSHLESVKLGVLAVANTEELFAVVGLFCQRQCALCTDRRLPRRRRGCGVSSLPYNFGSFVFVSLRFGSFGCCRWGLVEMVHFEVLGNVDLGCILGFLNFFLERTENVGLMSGFMLQCFSHTDLQSEEGRVQGHLSRWHLGTGPKGEDWCNNFIFLWTV
jgi:hypothetical protein